MTRRKTRDEISEYHLQKIDHRVESLKIALRDAQTSLTPFCQHDEAIGALITATVRTMNVLHGLPADYEQPPAAPFTRG